ncbi:Uncharacterised protein [uncultured archaeon]|nr:Uncharacterised protein [uncultured archaeon]
MMGRRRYGIRSRRNHARLGNSRRNLFAGQVSTDAGLCTLADLDLNSGSAIQVLCIYAETARSYLDNCEFSKLLSHLFWQAALTGVEVSSRFAGSRSQRTESVVADGSIGHGREEDGSLYHQIGRDLGLNLHFSVSCLDIHDIRLGAKEGAQLHWLAQGIYGGIGDLGGVEHNVIPIDSERLVVAAACEDYTSRLRLLLQVLKLLA